MNIGDETPVFTLKDQDQDEVSPDYSKTVLLSFHPLAWTGVCKDQMSQLEDNADKIAEKGAVTYGLSVDSFATKAAWAKDIGIEKTRLLCDFWPHGDIAKKLGIFDDEAGISKRANIIVKDGKIAWMKVYPIEQLPDFDEVLENL